MSRGEGANFLIIIAACAAYDRRSLLGVNLNSLYC